MQTTQHENGQQIAELFADVSDEQLKQAMDKRAFAQQAEHGKVTAVKRTQLAGFWRFPKRGLMKGFVELNGKAVDPQTEFCIDQTADGRLYYRDLHNSQRKIKSYILQADVDQSEEAAA